MLNFLQTQICDYEEIKPLALEGKAACEKAEEDYKKTESLALLMEGARERLKKHTQSEELEKELEHTGQALEKLEKKQKQQKKQDQKTNEEMREKL